MAAQAKTRYVAVHPKRKWPLTATKQFLEGPWGNQKNQKKVELLELCGPKRGRMAAIFDITKI